MPDKPKVSIDQEKLFALTSELEDPKSEPAVGNPAAPPSMDDSQTRLFLRGMHPSEIYPSEIYR